MNPQKIGLNVCFYIDGSHLFEDVFVDAYLQSGYSPKGVVAFDNSSSPHVA